MPQQAKYVYRNIEARSCNQCGSGRAIIITQSGYVFIALDIQHAMRMRHVVICGLSRSTIFFLHIISWTSRLSKQKFTEHIFSTAFVWNVFHCKKNWDRRDKRNVRRSAYKVAIFLWDFNETWIFSTDFQKKKPPSDTKLHQNPSSREPSCLLWTWRW